MTDQELRELVKETTKITHNNALAIDRLEQSQEKTDKQLDKLKESQEKTDEQMKKTDEQFKKSDIKWQKISDKIDRLGTMYGNSENNKGAEVEDFFYRYFYKRKRLPGGIRFDKVERGLIGSNEQEHDIVLINGKQTALISVKYKLTKQGVDDLIKREINRIKYFLGAVGSDHKLIGGVATFILDDKVEEYAKSKGLYVLTRKGKDTLVLNEEGFVGKEF